MGHPAMLGLVEHAGELLTKHLAGHDGRVGVELGELVYYRARPVEMDRSLNPRRVSGLWLGRRW
eukprot:1155490-Alexandrium_andersonii.AAC.1